MLVLQQLAEPHNSVSGKVQLEVVGRIDGQPETLEWADWPDEKLLDLRLCDLKLTVKGSQITGSIRQLNKEL